MFEFVYSCRRRPLFPAMALPWILAANLASAQAPEIEPLPVNPSEFTLFGEASGVDSTGDPDDRPIRRGRGPRDTAEPEFTLVGTSRIGDRYSAILKNRDGSEVVVTREAGRDTRIEGYSQFSVLDVSPGRVSIQYPAGTSCVEYSDRGVSCNSAANIASLELTIGEPIRRAEITRQRDSDPEDEGEVVVSEDEPEEPVNPFAALRARAQAAGDTDPAPAAAPRRGFTPRRIDPADVPPGMRIVSTPFGDRLVRDQ